MSVRALLLALAAVAAGCTPAAPDLATQAQRLMKRDQEWSQLAAAGKDVERTAAFWADDAVIIPQGQPVVEGRAAIHAFVADAFATPGFRISWKSARPVFSPDGRFAYMRGVNTTTMAAADGSPVTLSGRGLTIWRLDTDGQWRCVVDMWNDPPGSDALPRPPAR